MKYEYGVAHIVMDICSGRVETAHQSNMTEEEANQWISEWESDGGKVGAFVKVCRPIGDWELCE